MPMKILDIDMDFFLKETARFIAPDNQNRLSDIDYHPWTSKQIISFLEINLGLNKKRKIKGRIVEHHHEALYYWRHLTQTKSLIYPFEVVHVDSHADLGLGCSSWFFIFEELLGIDIEKRSCVEQYSEWFEKYKEPNIGDYLLFALAYRWISRLTYVCNPYDSSNWNDYLMYILKDCKEPNDKIQLPHNKPASDLNDTYKRLSYLKNAIKEPEVDFEIFTELGQVKYDGNFDFITFSVSPNYTPKSADFIIDIVKEYIDATNQED